MTAPTHTQDAAATAWRIVGCDPSDPYIAELIQRGAGPMCGGAPETLTPEQEAAAAAKAAEDAAAEAAKAAAEGESAKLIKELRAEAAARRVEAKELRDRLKVIEDERKTQEQRDAEAAQAAAKAERDREAQEAKRWSALRDQAIRGQIRGLATELQIHDADAVQALLPKDLEVDDLGVPINLDAAVRKLVQDKPFLAKTGAGSAGNPSRESQTPTAADLAKMTPHEKLAHAYAQGSTSS